MKKEEKILVPTKEKKTGPGSNPENTFKSTGTSKNLDNVISSPIDKTKARTGSGLANEGTAVSYEEER